MGTETCTPPVANHKQECKHVKLNNPLMGTETDTIESTTNDIQFTS